MVPVRRTSQRRRRKEAMCTTSTCLCPLGSIAFMSATRENLSMDHPSRSKSQVHTYLHIEIIYFATFRGSLLFHSPVILANRRHSLFNRQSLYISPSIHNTVGELKKYVNNDKLINKVNKCMYIMNACLYRPTYA